MNFKISISESRDLDLTLLEKLYSSCAWDRLKPDHEMQKAFEGSLRLITVTVDDRCIGFARLISDGKIYALLVDCMVDPEFRNRGVGKALLDFTVAEARRSGLKVIQLLASAAGRPLYARTGFIACPANSPGMIKFL